MKTKLFIFMAALIAGLLFCCLKVQACDAEGGTLYLLPKAGFEEYVAEIEPIEVIMPTYVLTDDEADLLLRVGSLEGGEANKDGIAHVMQVILNRVESDKFPDSVEGVVFESGQFCTASQLAIANITSEAYQALDEVIFGEFGDNKALYFESLEGKAWSKCHEYLFTYGGHDFYK